MFQDIYVLLIRVFLQSASIRLCSSRIYHYTPQGGLWEIPRGRASQKARFSKEGITKDWNFQTDGQWVSSQKNLLWEGFMYEYILEQFSR